jgi:hypothetical protein
MYCLVYVSSATHLMGDDELVEILEASRTRNHDAGITGMLLYKDGSFMQLLEGAKADVLGTYERIGRDRRHKGLIVVRQYETDARGFPDWSMGFRSVNAGDLRSLPGFADIGSRSFTSPAFTDRPDNVLRMLRTFYVGSS